MYLLFVLWLALLFIIIFYSLLIPFLFSLLHHHLIISRVIFNNSCRVLIWLIFCWPLLSPIHRRGWLRVRWAKRRLGLGAKLIGGKDTRVGLSPRCRLVSSEGLDGTSRAAAQRQRIAAQTSWKKKVESGVRLWSFWERSRIARRRCAWTLP